MQRLLDLCRHPATAVGLTLAAVAALVAQLRQYTILGMDSYPAIASGMMRGPGDLVAIFTSPAVPGRVPYAFKGFYRPITTASWGFDHLLFGMNPVGYQVEQALWFGACALMLYVLARRLMGNRATIGPLFALLVFLLLPSHVETLVVVARRSEFFCGLASLIALVLQVSRVDRKMPAGGLLPAFFVWLAIVSKATGLITVPLLFVVVFTMTERSGLWARTRQAAMAAVAPVAATAIALASQAAILGQVGGHLTSRVSGAVDRFGWAFRQLIGWLVLPQPALAESGAAQALLAALAIAVVSAAMLAVRDGRRAAPALRIAGPAFAVGMVWLFGLAALYGAVGLLQSWYVFVAALGFALVVGALAEAFFQVARSTAGPARSAAIAALVLAVLWFGWEGRYSMILTEYTFVARTSEATERYLARVQARIEAASDGEQIAVPVPPRELPSEPGELRIGAPLSIPPYAYQSWADAAFPGRKLRVVEKRRAGALEPDPGAVTVILGR